MPPTARPASTAASSPRWTPTGVAGDSHREVLGVGVGDSEDGAFWTAFLRPLKDRGLAGVQLLRNVLASMSRGSAEMVAAAIRTISAQPDAAQAHEQLDVVAGMLSRQFPKLEAMLRDHAEELLAFTSSRPRTGRRTGQRTPCATRRQVTGRRWEGLRRWAVAAAQ